MLNQLLHEIENARGPITLRELSRKLEIDPQTLEGMLQFWVRKGRIQHDDEKDPYPNNTSACSSSCSGPTNCAFIAKMPKTYSLLVVGGKENSDNTL
jgi:hypothetical protein